MAKTDGSTKSGLKPWMQEVLDQTANSPLLLVGTILRRTRLTGKNDRGDWEIFKVEVRGSEGRVCNVIVNSPASVPAVGEFVCLPVFVQNNGQLRESKDVGTPF